MGNSHLFHHRVLRPLKNSSVLHSQLFYGITMNDIHQSSFPVVKMVPNHTSIYKCIIWHVCSSFKQEIWWLCCAHDISFPSPTQSPEQNVQYRKLRIRSIMDVFEQKYVGGPEFFCPFTNMGCKYRSIITFSGPPYNNISFQMPRCA